MQRINPAFYARKMLHDNTPKPTDDAPLYWQRVPRKTLNELRERIWRVLVVRRMFRDTALTQAKLAALLGTNTRYVAATIQLKWGMSYTSFVNRHRIEYAKGLLCNARYADLTMQDIADMAGFANRQSFHNAFKKCVGMSPKAFKDSQ